MTKTKTKSTKPKRNLRSPKAASPSPRAPRPAPPGSLYLVGTPIGNLEDITLRALRVLREADLVACEDTRQTRKLLDRYEISKPVVSYHEHNEWTRAPELIVRLEEGATVALVSDAGMPLISDPGYRLVALAVRHHIPVVPVPGPAAFVAALIASGLPLDRFFFQGFLPSKRAARSKVLKELQGVPNTLIFYEAPHRIRETLAEMRNILGDREAVMARELTKVHEEFLRGRLSALFTRMENSPVRGEITLLIAPSGEEPAGLPGRELSLAGQVAQLMDETGAGEKEAVKQVARQRGLRRSDAYRQWQAEKGTVRRKPLPG